MNSGLRYTGLRNALSVGMSVAESAEQIRRFVYVERRMMRLLVSRVVTIPERDVKALLARLQYEDALHADALGNRLVEMRTNRSKLRDCPDSALETAFDEAEHLPGTYPFLRVVRRVLKQSLLDEYESYIREANGLADYPSVYALRSAVTDEAEHIRLLDLALDSLEPTESDLQQAGQWESKIKSYLEAAGGFRGRSRRGKPVARVTATQPYKIPRELVRDDTLERVWDYVAPPLEEIPAHLDYMMGLRLSEINVSEGLAIVLFETEGMPWSFYLDISRHCWDEMRHSLFGEAGIEFTYGDRSALPMRDYEGAYVMEASPLEQYAVLGLEVEGKNMRYPPGKRQEWEFARDMAKHTLMATLQDFDWADEVLHVNIARRELDGWFEGGLRTIGEFSKGGREHRTEVKGRHQPSHLPHPTRS